MIKKEPVILTDDKLREIADHLVSLFKSCHEGLDGTWDPSGEGSDGFSAMADSAQEIGKLLGLEKELDAAYEEHQAALLESDDDEDDDEDMGSDN